MGDMISNSRLFVDANATDGGTSGAALWLEFVQNMKVTDERGVEVKKVMGKKRGGGFIRKGGGGTITISEYRQTDPQVPWRRWCREDKIFGLFLQDDDGIREKWFFCTVSKVDRSDNEEGEHMDEIEIKFLDGEEST